MSNVPETEQCGDRVSIVPDTAQCGENVSNVPDKAQRCDRVSNVPDTARCGEGRYNKSTGFTPRLFIKAAADKPSD